MKYAANHETKHKDLTIIYFIWVVHPTTSDGGRLKGFQGGCIQNTSFWGRVRIPCEVGFLRWRPESGSDRFLKISLSCLNLQKKSWQGGNVCSNLICTSLTPIGSIQLGAWTKKEQADKKHPFISKPSHTANPPQLFLAICPSLGAVCFFCGPPIAYMFTVLNDR